ncbi:MAG: DUF1295 domain-containing protein [Cyclobacteriaceae bacterium]
MSKSLFQSLLVTEAIYGLIAFIILFFIAAPYGRHVKKGWGPTVSARLAWIIQELPAILVISFWFIYHQGYLNVLTTVFFIIWQAHYLHRGVVYPFQINHPDKPYPLLLVIFAIIFNSLNGSLNGHEIFSMNNYELEWLYSPQFVLGVIIFVSGFIINKHSDTILKELKNSGEYHIPQKGLFKYVSCPNYLGELMEWLGWGILTWSLAGFGFFFFTFANLFPRALANHKWYKQKFPEYPPNRKAIFPGII